MKIIDEQLMNGLAEEAKKSPRLRKNYNFHQSLQDKCHRFLNALEPGTFIPVHHHPDKDETFVILRGKVRVTTYNDKGEIVESYVISQESGRYGVDIPKNVWHGLECLEPSVLLECKAGPFVEHDVDGILETKPTKDIYLAGGCFWGTEHYFKQIKGVAITEVGFANGHTENPTYKDVYTDQTGFAETSYYRCSSRPLIRPVSTNKDTTRGHAIALVYTTLTQRIYPLSIKYLLKSRRTTSSLWP